VAALVAAEEAALAVALAAAMVPVEVVSAEGVRHLSCPPIMSQPPPPPPPLPPLPPPPRRPQHRRQS